MDRRLLILKVKNCAPCARQAQIIEEVKPEIHKNGIYIEEEDIHSKPELVDEYGITSAPTVVLLNKKGKLLKKWSGVKDAGEIRNILELNA